MKSLMVTVMVAVMTLPLSACGASAPSACDVAGFVRQAAETGEKVICGVTEIEAEPMLTATSGGENTDESGYQEYRITIREGE